MADYDVIVVGAGPGGAAAAKTAAELGLKTLMLERAAVPGQKNMSGSMFFRPVLEDVFPGFEDAPFMRDYPVIEGGKIGIMMDDGVGFTVGPHYHSKTMDKGIMIFRDHSDQWLAQTAVDAGAELRCSVARDIIRDKDGNVIGVVVDEGEKIYAPVTIAADGFNSVIGHKAGLYKSRRERDGYRGEGITISIKYCYYLGEEECARRSKAEYWPEDGMYHEYDSEPVWNGPGSIDKHGDRAATWTAHALMVPAAGLVTVACYQHLSDLCKVRQNIHQRMQWFLTTPEIRHAIEGAELVAIDCHTLTWENRDGYVPKSYLPGLMMVGDAAAMINPFDGFGADAAMYAGVMAAKVAKEAIDKKDFSEAMFKKYEDMWRDSFIGENENMPRELAHWLFNQPELMPVVMDILEQLVDYKMGCKPYSEFVSSPRLLGNVAQLLPLILPLLGILKFPLKKGTDVLGGLLGGLGDE